jgi:hypothetical protein
VPHGAKGPPPYLLTPGSWPLVLGLFALAVGVTLVGYLWEVPALRIAGWVLLSLWVVGIVIRALAIETRAALADGLSYRDGFWRFARLIAWSALTGLISGLLP